MPFFVWTESALQIFFFSFIPVDCSFCKWPLETLWIAYGNIVIIYIFHIFVRSDFSCVRCVCIYASLLYLYVSAIVSARRSYAVTSLYYMAHMHQSHCSIGQSCRCLEQGVCKTTLRFSAGLLGSHVVSVCCVSPSYPYNS